MIKYYIQVTNFVLYLSNLVEVRMYLFTILTGSNGVTPWDYALDFQNPQINIGIFLSCFQAPTPHLGQSFPYGHYPTLFKE